MGRADDLGPAELAACFAAQLEHLREFRGVHYVGGMPVPGIGSPLPDEAPGGDDPKTAPGGGHERVEDVQKRVLREQATQWTPAKKLAYLRDRNLGDCQRCRLSQGRQSIVFGVGNPEAELLFVGEGPGAEEDRRGEPFVGAAGQRLDRWIEAIGLRRSDVYIANVIKCRPPANRDPKPDEISACAPFLHAQIRAIAPKVIVALGRFAGTLLLGQQLRMYQMRGQAHEYVQEAAGLRIPLIVTYHPSYVLRSEKGPPRGPDNSGPRKSENEVVLGDLEMAVKHVAEAG